MNPIEAAICERLRKFREMIEWPQVVFARETGITRDQLASIEYGRTPLRYGLARRLAERYSINWRWLATGEGSPQPYWSVPPEIARCIPDKLLLSKAYSQFIEPAIPAGLRDFLTIDERTGATQSVLPPTNIPPAWPHQWFVMDAMRDAFNQLPLKARADLCDEVLAAINRYCVEHGVTTFCYPQTFGAETGNAAQKEEPARRASHHGRKEEWNPERGKETLVDKQSKADYQSSSDMKIRWRDYQKKLKALCKVRGTKAAIAKKLKVSRTIVSRWASGQAEPTADFAFQLIEWIDDHGTSTPN